MLDFQTQEEPQANVDLLASQVPVGYACEGCHYLDIGGYCQLLDRYVNDKQCGINVPIGGYNA